MILEQFKNTLPGRIAMYITERQVTTAVDAAVSADEYVLLHKSSFGESAAVRNDFGWRRNN